MKTEQMNKRESIDNQFNDILLSDFDIKNNYFIKEILKELLLGKPISKDRYFELADLPSLTAKRVLEKLGELDEHDNLVAFSGLSLKPTQHQFNVNGVKLFAWCAVDTIMFAKWLEIEAEVQTNDPLDGSLINLRIKGDQLLSTSHEAVYVSWLDSVDTCNIRVSFCDHVSFFAHQHTAQKWLENNKEGKILTINEFYDTNNVNIECC